MKTPIKYLIQLLNKRRFFFYILILFFMNSNIFSKEITECIIKNYEITKTGKILLSKTVKLYDQKNRIVEERYYQGDFSAIPLHTILKYEYSDENTEIQYTYSRHWTSRKNVSIFDKNGNITKMISYYTNDNPSQRIWEKNYTSLNYTKNIEHEFEYNDKNDLILAKSIQGKFVDMPGPLESLPNDGLNGKVEEFKYVYNEKSLKTKIFGKNNRRNDYSREWQYFYGTNNNIIKLEKYVRNELLNYFTYIYNNKLEKEISYFIGKEGIKVTHYYSYEYYENGLLKNKNYHNHMDFKKIEDMKIYAYDEYTYK